MPLGPHIEFSEAWQGYLRAVETLWEPNARQPQAASPRFVRGPCRRSHVADARRGSRRERCRRPFFNSSPSRGPQAQPSFTCSNSTSFAAAATSPSATSDDSKRDLLGDVSTIAGSAKDIFSDLPGWVKAGIHGFGEVAKTLQAQVANDSFRHQTIDRTRAMPLRPTDPMCASCLASLEAAWRISNSRPARRRGQRRIGPWKRSGSFFPDEAKCGGEQEGQPEVIVPIESGVCLTIPLGTHFQFRSLERRASGRSGRDHAALARRRRGDNRARQMGSDRSLTESRVTIHMVASLDGFIARKDGRVDWLETSDEFEGGETLDPEFVQEFLKTIDCYVMGSRTYETALDSRRRDSAGPMATSRRSS